MVDHTAAECGILSVSTPTVADRVGEEWSQGRNLGHTELSIDHSLLRLTYTFPSTCHNPESSTGGNTHRY